MCVTVNAKGMRTVKSARSLLRLPSAAREFVFMYSQEVDNPNVLSARDSLASPTIQSSVKADLTAQ